MKITLTNLEEARRDPSAFKSKMAQANDGPQGRFGHQQLLECSILRWHKRRMSVPVARQMLIDWFTSKWPNSKELPRIVASFDDYVTAYQSLNHQYAGSNIRLALGLAPAFQEEFQITGKLALLDVTPTGYAAWVFSKTLAAWRDQLRMPAMQIAVAESLDADYSEISVGVYCFEDNSHHSFVYTDDELKAAMDELEDLMNLLR